jgi:hypothetical protein
MMLPGGQEFGLSKFYGSSKFKNFTTQQTRIAGRHETVRNFLSTYFAEFRLPYSKGNGNYQKGMQKAYFYFLGRITSREQVSLDVKTGLEY